MMLVVAAIWAFAVTSNAWSPWRYHGHDQLTVSTTSGHVQGKIDSKFPRVRQFLGIPFAKPPVGDLRWTAPQALSQPDAKIEATSLPPSCMQYLGTAAGVYTSEVLEFNLQGLNRTGDISEDCLTLSVWTPSVRKRKYGWHKSGGKNKKLPVLIYFYGGGWNTGGQDVPYQIPTQWVNRSPNHIVVSFNYRVNIFGFTGGAKGIEDQNVGYLDQRLAVEWIKENIAAFGGDASRMVIWGQSAGAGSVDVYNYAYPDDPIVTGLIMDSGTAFIGARGDRTGANFSYVATQLGCTDSDDQLACMRKLSAKVIEDFVANNSNSGGPSLSFNPSPDGKIVFANYTERALAGKFAKIPAIIGTNKEDGVPFAPYSPNGPNTTLANAALLRTFFCPATETARLRQEVGRLTYRYLYSGNFTNVSPKPWLGAYHSAELPLLFGTHPNYRGPSTDLEYATSCAMQDAWVAFASDPKSGLAAKGWKAYEELGSEDVRDFGAGVAAKDTTLADVEAQCDGENIAS